MRSSSYVCLTSSHVFLSSGSQVSHMGGRLLRNSGVTHGCENLQLMTAASRGAEMLGNYDTTLSDV
jgi:hypothetical protein